MPCLPKIDQPCPLDRTEQARLSGFCGRCEKTVHVLDDLGSDQRRALLRRAAGPICVSYRVSAGLGAALALTLAATPAQASASPAGLPAAPHAAAALPGTASGTPAGPQTPVVATEPAPPTCEDLEMIMVGGISRPDEAEWLEQESDLPELPVREAPSHRG
jgi:hypothetical protein